MYGLATRLLDSHQRPRRFCCCKANWQQERQDILHGLIFLEREWVMSE